ncbi:serine aminopeptidase domain-containing protein [Actinoplanes sp. DH11]|uniref:alpha/beta hydrolase family protein n=1 Tax=Actinoplanes sp. DH11 TaxID=2857011 RepID=UPI001E3C39A5|nr:alpha/beta hydrolase [Actinoplanes sp. DH11]
MSPNTATRKPARRIRRAPAIAGALAAVTLGAAAVTLIPNADAATASFEKGPAPSNSSIEATRGPFAVSQTAVTRTAASGFGGGDIYFPTDTSAGTFGAVVIAPGFTARKSSMAWLAPRIASQGFVVFNIDTTTTSDQPASRGRQLLAAADFLTKNSSVRTRVDATRVAVMGHSMGGGGTLEAAKSRPSLQAAIPLTPWNVTKSFRTNAVPTLIIGAENDTVASVRSHSEPFFQSLPASPGKAYLELNGASHFAPNTPNTTIAKFSISWLKLFVDNDTRYKQFVCPGPGTSTAVQEYRNTCDNFTL